MGYATPLDLINGISDVTDTVYVDPQARAEYGRLMLRDGMVREYEYQVRARDGAVLWLSDSASAVRNEAGEIVRYEGTVRDITDQKRAEDAIAEGRRLLQMVIDTVPAVINVKDKQLRYVLMNRYMAGIFGIEPGDAIGHTTTDLMSRYGAEKTDENDKRVLAAGRELGFYEEEYRDSVRQSCGNGWSTSCRSWTQPARSRTSSPSRSISANASASNSRCARPRTPPKPRCAICAKRRTR